MAETVANGYLFDSAQRELFNEYQYNRARNIFHNFLLSCALEESYLNSRRLKMAFKVEINKVKDFTEKRYNE